MNTQVEIAFIGLLVALVEALQTVIVSYFGRSAKNSAIDAATTASTAAAQVLHNTSKIDEVKTIVNGQTSALIAHNQALQDTLAAHGIAPPPVPTVPPSAQTE